MRPIYLFLKIILKVSTWLFFPFNKCVNAPKKRYARTIFMSNHSSSFMDPLVIASNQHPILFFMTRSDIFKPLLQPILWASHMLPIYRQLDGKDTKKKNEETFKKCSKVLRGGRNLLVFSEGFTDDTFIRRLKPIKKGAIRIGFDALESMNWNKNIYIQALGVNYSNPNSVSGDCLISNGEPICLNEYKNAYQEDSNKTIHQLTKKMELEMRAQITDIRDKKRAPFHENIMRFTRKGMCPENTDRSIPLVERWRYSQRLADWMNSQKVEEKEELMQLQVKMEDYFKALREKNWKESILYKILTNKREKWKELLYLIALFPFMLFGLLLGYIPYKITKEFVEKSFKRKVFWGGVKMMVGFALVSIYNIILLLLATFIIPISFWMLLLVGIAVVPVMGGIAYSWFQRLNTFQETNRMEKYNFSKLARERRTILEAIQRLVPVA